MPIRCTMHHGSTTEALSNPAPVHQSHQHADGDHSSGRHNGTSAHGCTCAGECNRLAPQLTLERYAELHLGFKAAEQSNRTNRVEAVSADLLLPPTTGPPAVLRT